MLCVMTHCLHTCMIHQFNFNVSYLKYVYTSSNLSHLLLQRMEWHMIFTWLNPSIKHVADPERTWNYAHHFQASASNKDRWLSSLCERYIFRLETEWLNLKLYTFPIAAGFSTTPQSISIILLYGSKRLLVLLKRHQRLC